MVYETILRADSEAARRAFFEALEPDLMAAIEETLTDATLTSPEALASALDTLGERFGDVVDQHTLEFLQLLPVE